jgi:hypothetical protein
MPVRRKSSRKKRFSIFRSVVFVDVDAARIEHLDQHGVRIARIDSRVDAAVAAHARRVARERQRDRAQILDVDADREQARDDAAVHHARRRMRVAAGHHGLARFERRAERLAELHREFGRQFDVREPLTPTAPNSEPGHLMP